MAVVGLGKSGVAATLLLRRQGVPVYASDIGRRAEPYDALGRDAAGARAPRSSSAATTWRGSRARRRSWWRRACRPTRRRWRPRGGPGSRSSPRSTSGFLALRGTRCIGITGTNGKTTTTALTAHLLAAARGPRRDRGQHRPAALSTWRSRRTAAGLARARALARSSCTTRRTSSPRSGVLTNLAPDHLDRYASLEEYYGDKALLFRNADADVGLGQQRGRSRGAGRWCAAVPGTHLRFSVARAGRRLVRPRGRAGSCSAMSRSLPRASCRSWAITTWPTRSRPPWWRPRRVPTAKRIADGLRTFRASRTGWSRCARWTACSGSTIPRRPTSPRPRWRSPRWTGRSSCCSADGTRASPTPAGGAAARTAAARWSRSARRARSWCRTSGRGCRWCRRAAISTRCSPRARRLAQPGDAVLLSPPAPATTCSRTTRSGASSSAQRVEAM